MNKVISLDEYRKRKLRKIVDDAGTLHGVKPSSALSGWFEKPPTLAELQERLPKCEFVTTDDKD